MPDASMIFEQIRPWIIQLSETERLRLIRAIAGVASAELYPSATTDNQWVEPVTSEQRSTESVDESAERLLVEQEWWYQLPQAKKARYQNEFVAVYGGKVVDHDGQRLALLRRVRQKFGQAPVAILPAEQTRVPEYTLHHPQIVS